MKDLTQVLLTYSVSLYGILGKHARIQGIMVYNTTTTPSAVPDLSGTVRVWTVVTNKLSWMSLQDEHHIEADLRRLSLITTSFNPFQ